MAKFFLVRHGETRWNKEQRYQGCSDVPLSSVGMAQAQMLRERLSSEDIDVIYASDLCRAMETARIIASAHKLQVIVSRELRELDFGELEGMPVEEVNQRYPQIARAWSTHPPDFVFPGGEGLQELFSRVSPFARRLQQDHSEKTVLIVTHGGVVRALLCALLGLGLEHWWQLRVDAASLTVVESYSDRMTLSQLNDTCHLK